MHNSRNAERFHERRPYPKSGNILDAVLVSKWRTELVFLGIELSRKKGGGGMGGWGRDKQSTDFILTRCTT